MMSNVAALSIKLYGVKIGTLALIPGDKSIFGFTEDYIENTNRPIMGLRFIDVYGQLKTDFRPYGPAVMPFFSNLLPEGHLRKYLAEQADVKTGREFHLLQALGNDLPGAITVSLEDIDEKIAAETEQANDTANDSDSQSSLRFSLAGVQLKFSAIADARGGLTIPARGVGGSWIVKLPSREFEGVPENEYSMMTIARLMGMDVPAIDLVKLDTIGNLPEGLGTLKGDAFIIERFDRLDDGSPVHIEDFAQVFDVYPRNKYKRASYANIATVIASEGSNDDVVEYIRRLVFNALIGNADMHLKNWSLRYLDRRNATLAPAYDFLSTTPYIPDETSALNFSRTKRYDQLTKSELSHLANKARISDALVIKTAEETVERFHQIWKTEKANLPIHQNVLKAVERNIEKIPLVKES